MEYELKPSYFFLQQIDELSDEAKRVVENRLRLVKVNPFRNKRIHGLVKSKKKKITSSPKRQSLKGLSYSQ